MTWVNALVRHRFDRASTDGVSLEEPSLIKIRSFEFPVYIRGSSEPETDDPMSPEISVVNAEPTGFELSSESRLVSSFDL